MYLEKDIRVYIFEKSRKERPLFHECYHFDLHLRTRSPRFTSCRKVFSYLGGGARVDTFHSNAKSRVEKYELREYRCCILAITTSLEDVLQGRKSYRRGGEKREIRGKGKDGGTNKVHRGGGWRDSRW